MSNYTAAYCSACGAYVLVSAEGGCQYGHPRSSLRGIYSAQIDRRTGRPTPPSLDQRGMLLRPTPPVAPIALPTEAPHAGLQAPESYPMSVSAPLAPVISAMGPSILSRPMVGADKQGLVARLFGPARGRHSAGVLAFGPPKGRHASKGGGGGNQL